MFPSNSSVTIWQPLLVRTHQVQWCYYYHCCLHTGSHLAQTVLQLSISQEWSRSFFLINKNFSKNKFIFSFFWNFRSCTLILLTTPTHISAPLPWSSPQRKFKKIKPNKSKAKQTNKSQPGLYRASSSSIYNSSASFSDAWDHRPEPLQLGCELGWKAVPHIP